MLSSLSNKLAIGTAQFGFDYGISNKSGKVLVDEVKSILNDAYNLKINTIDTAISYGSSEQILGQIGVEKFSIVTKLPTLPKNIVDIRKWVFENLNSSLIKLNLQNIDTLLIHNSTDIFGDKGKRIFDAITELKQEGIVQKIGVSIYDPNELDVIHNQKIKLDIVQAPFNVFDRRLESSGWLSKLKESNIEIHTRSIFLQGLLLMSSQLRPIYFSKWDDHFNLWDNWLAINNFNALEACINFIKSYSVIDKIIIGVTSANELKEINKIYNKTEFIKPPDFLQINSPSLINPSFWFDS